jgi:hypothetical protein
MTSPGTYSRFTRSIRDLFETLNAFAAPAGGLRLLAKPWADATPLATMWNSLQVAHLWFLALFVPDWN